MNKKKTILPLVVLSLIGVVGCGNPSNSSQEPSSETPSSINASLYSCVTHALIK